jgi:GH35 family endo-1,4-beta-xylanase
VWYSQTPDWFFKEGFQSNGAYVSKDVMDKRLEDMIKKTFAAIKKDYPKLDLYAYDVCNELFLNDGGGLRKKEFYQRPGDSYGSGGSDWAKVYGEDNNEFIIKAFKYARQYAPAGCKLYMNDYNEYMPDKRENLVEMAKAILKEGPYIDGIGMQSHLSDGYPDAKTYEDAILAFSALGLDVQVTELDITKDSGNDSKWEQAYEDIYKVILKHADKISSVTLWGIADNHSWRGSKSPLLWSAGPTPKAIYQKVCDLTSQYPAPSPVVVTTAAPVVTTAAPVVTTAAPTVTTAAPDQTRVPALVTTAAPVLKPTKRGDVDVNGYVDVSDAVLAAKYNAGQDDIIISDVGLLNADYDGNGEINGNDVTKIVMYIVGLI